MTHDAPAPPNTGSAHERGTQAILLVVRGSLDALRKGLVTMRTDAVAGGRMVSDAASTLSKAVSSLAPKIDSLAVEPVEETAPTSDLDEVGAAMELLTKIEKGDVCDRCGHPH